MGKTEKKALEVTKAKMYQSELKRMILKEWKKANIKISEMQLLVGMAEHFGLKDFAGELKQSIENSNPMQSIAQG